MTSPGRPSPIRMGIFGYTLGAYAMLGFLVAFFGSRAFALLNPSIVVANGEVHFHHFWYGLGMVALTGWLGITYNKPRLLRTYSLVFGLGAGLIGDEVGLLLTFGNYQSDLTTDFFVGVIGFIILVPMILQYKTAFRKDTVHQSYNERLIHVGILLVGVSTIFFAIKTWTPGVLIAGLGVLTIIASFEAAKVGLVAGLAGGSILAAGNFFLLDNTSFVTTLLGGQVLPPELAISVDQLAFLLALAASIASLLFGVIGGALLGLVFSAVKGRYLKTSSLQRKGLVFGIILWIISGLYSLTVLNFGVWIVSSSLVIGLVASLVYGYLLGRLFPRFERKMLSVTARSKSVPN